MAAGRRANVWAVYVLFHLILWIQVSQAQGVLRDPHLKISGPEGQTVIIVERYYDRGIVTKTVTSRVDIGEGLQSRQLEFGHDGLRVFVVIPTSRPVTVWLSPEGEQWLRQAESSKPSVLRLAIGDTAASDRYQPPRALLNAAERAWVARFFSAISQASTADIVSQLPAANIDWPTLDAFCEALNAELGEIAAPSRQLDGWLSWDGRFGTRVISGVSQFERGSCRFTLVVVDGKLVDVLAESDELPSDWFAGPSSEAIYIAASETLARKLISGDVSSAHALFSSKVHEQVTTDVLETLSQGIRREYGTEVAGMQLKQTLLSDYDVDSASRTLSISHLVHMVGGHDCITQVDFVFSCGPNEISRGHLSSFHVRESWRTSHPQQVRATQQALTNLFLGKTEEFIDDLHPGLAAYLERGEVASLSAQMQSEWGSMTSEADWDMWFVDAVGDNLIAKGQIEVESGAIDVRADFSEGKLLGLSLFGPSYAASTLNALSQVDRAAELGSTFCEHVFSGRLTAAHAQLSPAFQEQLPLSPFQDLIAASDVGQLSEFKRVQLDTIRLADRLERTISISFAAYYIVHFADGSFQPMRCEFRPVPDRTDEFELINFNTDFETTFPVDDSSVCTPVLTAFLSGDPQAVMNLFSADQRDVIDPQLLGAFMRKLSDQGFQPMPPRCNLLHTYTPGNRVELLRSVLKSELAQLPLEATLQLGNLKAFHIISPALSNFASELESVDGLQSLGERFIRLWMTDGQTEQALQLMVQDLREAGVLERLKKLRDQLQNEHGAFVFSESTTWSASEVANEVTLNYELVFTQDMLPCEIVFEVDATSARVLRLIQPIAN